MVKAIATTVLIAAAGAVAAATAMLPAKYVEALTLIHSYSGSGTELGRAMQIAEQLSRSHPKSGYAQALQAEALSTWGLEQDGQPRDVLEQTISLADEALQLDPKLTQAHVALARAFVRASRYEAAELHISTALELDPALAGAMFIRAEAFRRTNQIDSAEAWYLKFIESVESKPRKANGYYWIGKMYQDLAWDRPVERQILTGKARRAYEAMLAQEPSGAWRNVNVAIFLNGFAADFDGAERYASIALREMEFSMARYHLAAARYQRLWEEFGTRDRVVLAASIKNVAVSTQVSLEDALSFRSFSSVVRERLRELQARVKTE